VVPAFLIVSSSPRGFNDHVLLHTVTHFSSSWFVCGYFGSDMFFADEYNLEISDIEKKVLLYVFLQLYFSFRRKNIFW